MKNNIPIITKNFPPQTGGIETYCQDLCTKLIQHGDEIKLIATCPGKEKFLAKKSFFFLLVYLIFEFFRLARFLVRCFMEGLWRLGKRVNSETTIIWSGGASYCPGMGTGGECRYFVR